MIFLIAFAVLFVLCLAFSSGKSQTVVRRVDPETGEEQVEIHETNTPSAARSAAQLLIIVIILFVLFVMFIS